jgi:Fe-S-cluster containining protein
MNEEDLKKQTVQFRKLVGDELFWFTMEQNVKTMEKDKQRFAELALQIQTYFECERCCKCCSEMPIHLNDEDVERLHQLDGDTLFDKMDANEMDNFLRTPCPYLNGDVCTIYENRPAACKMFPFVVIRPVPTLQLCPMGQKIFEKFKDLTRTYGKRDLKVEWESAEPPEVGENQAVYVALPIPVLKKFLQYLRLEER